MFVVAWFTWRITLYLDRYNKEKYENKQKINIFNIGPQLNN